MIAETKRLLISKVDINDAAFFLELMNTPQWLKYIGDRNIGSLEDAKNYIKKSHLVSYKTLGYGFYKLILKDNNKTIGTCGLVKRDNLDFPDIGFAMLPKYQGQGFGLEASSEILQLAKERFNINTVYAITLPTNKNSIKLIEKLGLDFEKKVKPFDDDEELLLFAKDL